MAQRAMSITAVKMMSCRTHGTGGMRYGRLLPEKWDLRRQLLVCCSLIDWIMSTEITGDPYTSARYTIVSKATSDEEDRSALLTTVLEPIFAPKQKKAV